MRSDFIAQITFMHQIRCEVLIVGDEACGFTCGLGVEKAAGKTLGLVGIMASLTCVIATSTAERLIITH